MNHPRRVLDLIALGGCAFVLTKALLSMFLLPGDNPADGNPVFKLILTLSYLAVTAVLLTNYRETLFALRRNWSLVALLVLTLLSCLWADSPSIVLQRSIAVLGTTLFGLALAVRLTLQDQLRLMSWVFRIIAVLSLVCVVLLPRYGVSGVADQEGAWRGVFVQKNGLGAAMALSLLVEWHLPTDTFSSKVFNRLALLLGASLLYFSRSITPAVALVASLLFIQVYKFAVRRLRMRAPFAVALTALLLLTACIATPLLDSERIAGTLGRSSDLTGRTEIWRWVISYISERPILGYGYAGFWFGASPDSLAIDRAMGTRIMYSHNGYLEILLTLGGVGFVLALAFLGIGMKRAFDYSERGQSGVHFWPLAILFFVMLHNFGECTILFQDLEWALCVAGLVAADPVLVASVAEQEQEVSLLVPSEEFS
jgi:O-antigen ligase